MIMLTYSTVCLHYVIGTKVFFQIYYETIEERHLITQYYENTPTNDL